MNKIFKLVAVVVVLVGIVAVTPVTFAGERNWELCGAACDPVERPIFRPCAAECMGPQGELVIEYSFGPEYLYRF